MHLMTHIVTLLPTKVIGDLAGTALWLSLAYLAYAPAHMLADRLEGRQRQPCIFFRRMCRALMYVLILLIALLHAVEYAMRGAHSA